MYKEKYPDKVEEKFPPKKIDDNFSPSERARMEEVEEEEIIQKPRPAGTGPEKTETLKEKRIRMKKEKEE